MANKNTKIKDSLDDKIMYTVVTTIMIIFLIIILYPLIFVLSSSFSSGLAVTAGRVILWPVDFSITGYKILLGYKSVWTGYKNTIIYTVGGTAINMVLTVCAAYPLSRRNFQGRNLYMMFFMFTMFFGGGLIPNYLVKMKLGLVDNRLVLMLGMSVYNTIIMRTFFCNSVPGELLEAAKIDGISDFGYLFKILIPLSKAVFAVITLYYSVGHWNSYFGAMLYLRGREKYPLQLILRDIMKSANVDLTDIDDPELIAQLKGAADLIKYALIVVSTVPILCVYPFVQRYFEKGVMIGSVKG